MLSLDEVLRLLMIRRVGFGAYISSPANQPPPVEFFTDNFTDTDGTAITSHTPDSGGTWAIYSGTDTVSIQSNHVFSTLANVINASAAPPSANYYVEAVIDVITNITNDNVGVCGRIVSGGNDFYAFVYNRNNGTWQLFRCVAGTLTPIGASFGMGWVSGSRTARLEMIGSTINGYVDGTLRCTATDATFAGAGSVGFRWATAARTTTTGRHVKSIKAVG